MDIIQVSHHLDQLLDIHAIQDSGNAMNGLQVQNTGEIRKVGLAVDVCFKTLQMAKEEGCDMLFVHHGLFWSGLQAIRGSYFEKLSLMIRENIGLYSAHIPLDIHPVLGNNKALADLIGLERLQPFGEYKGQKIGLKGTLVSQSAEKLGKMLEQQLGSPVKVIGKGLVQMVGLVTGGAGDMLRDAIAEGLDCYITGEASAHHFHEAEEGNCVLILAGHYATETGGVKAVGSHLEQTFGLETIYLDYPTGM